MTRKQFFAALGDPHRFAGPRDPLWLVGGGRGPGWRDTRIFLYERPGRGDQPNMWADMAWRRRRAAPAKVKWLIRHMATEQIYYCRTYAQVLATIVALKLTDV